MKVFYINLKQMLDRNQSMEEGFGKEDLVRIDAVDGLDWAHRTLDSKGFRPWKNGSREGLVGDKLLHPDCPLYPTMVACNLSHKLALEAALSSLQPWSVILEDDVEPTETYRQAEGGFEECLEIPGDCDMLYLCSPDHPGRVVDVRKDGQVTKAATLMGYAVSRRGAKLLLDTMLPIRDLFDYQGPLCCVESLEHRLGGSMPKEAGSKEKIHAYACTQPGLVRLSPLSRSSSLRPKRR